MSYQHYPPIYPPILLTLIFVIKVINIYQHFIHRVIHRFNIVFFPFLCGFFELSTLSTAFITYMEYIYILFIRKNFWRYFMQNPKPKEMKKSVDKNVFSHTAKKTKALNVVPLVKRGGIRL